MTIYNPFTLFKSNRLWFEKYKSGIFFGLQITEETVYLVFHNLIGRPKKVIKWASSKVLNNLNGIIGCPEKSTLENCPSPSKLPPPQEKCPPEHFPQENCPTGKLPPRKMLPKNRFTSFSLLLTLSYNCSFLNFL